VLQVEQPEFKELPWVLSPEEVKPKVENNRSSF
jgi:hypothetical protein